MDIDEMVSRARPERQAGWAQTTQGQRVLEGVRSGQPGSAHSAADRSWLSRSRLSRQALRWSFAGTGLVGAAVAVALVVAAAVSTPDENGRQVPAVTTLGARDILLAAAGRAEQAPAGTGRYWHVKTVDVTGPIRVGAPPSTYWLLKDAVNENWQARAAGDASWQGYRELGAHPRGGADEQAWRAAGSPAEWNLGPSDTVDGHDLILSTRPGRGMLVKADGATRYLRDLGQLDLAGVQGLPTDEAALRAWLTGQIQSHMGFAPHTPDGDRLLFGALSDLLLDTPAPPKVRAAAFRVLADIPGVSALGEVKDDSGRPGLGVELAQQRPTETYVQQLIVDPDTHLLLAEKVVSTVTGKAKASKEHGTLVLAAEWTDARPQVPTIPTR